MEVNGQNYASAFSQRKSKSPYSKGLDGTKGPPRHFEFLFLLFLSGLEPRYLGPSRSPVTILTTICSQSGDLRTRYVAQTHIKRDQIYNRQELIVTNVDELLRPQLHTAGSPFLSNFFFFYLPHLSV